MRNLLRRSFCARKAWHKKTTSINSPVPGVRVNESQSMKIILICALIFIASCTTQTKSIKHEGRTLVVKNGIEIEKAKVIFSQFLLQESRFSFKRKITIAAHEEKYRKMCHASTLMPESEKEFCGAQYIISYSADPYCFGGSSVIENCESGKCIYKISEYSELCE